MAIYSEITMIQQINLKDTLMYILLTACLFTSGNWGQYPELTQGEIFRFDKILLFGQIDFYYLFGAILFFAILLTWFNPHNERTLFGERNFLKTIFWLYFIPVNILQYLAIYLKDISLDDLGIRPIVRFFIFLVFVYFIQDIFLKDKNINQMEKIITSLEVLILIRCLMTIVKYHLGYGHYIAIIGNIRIGQENDFADFFVLLFIISLARLLFENNNSRLIKVLHYSGILCSSYVIIFSFRRYLWIEFIVGLGIILLCYYYYNRTNLDKIIISASLIIFFISSLLFFMGPKRLIQNPFMGRFLTSLSLVDSSFVSQYGTNTGHTSEIIEGWQNVRKHWLLGVTIYGHEKIERYETSSQAGGVYVHNAFLGIWLVYGLFGLILFISIYLKSINLGYKMYKKFNSTAGLILLTFLICQALKNIVWHTVITFSNITVIYILMISIVLKSKTDLMNKKP